MKRGAQRDVAIVDAIGVERDVGVGRATAEEVHRAALADKLHRLLPGFRRADGLNGDVDSAIAGSEGTGFADGFVDDRGLDNMRGAKLSRSFNLAVVLDDGDGLESGERGHVQNHEAKRPTANDGNCVALARIGVLEPVDGAGQGLGERGVFERHVLRNDERVLGDDAFGNLDEFGISAVVEEQIVAKIFLATQAKVALAARSGVERHNPVAGSEIGDALARFDDRSCLLVSEERGRNDHARVVSAAKDLEIGAAGESCTHLDD